MKDADLTGVNLRNANVSEADLRGANLRRASLLKTDFRHADLAYANLQEANLTAANLSSSTLVRTNLTGADLTGCRVYGASVWGAKLDGAVQSDLVITAADETEITADNIEVAQFLYLLLNNERIRHVIESITSKLVLILGRFTPARKTTLDAIRDALRQRDYLPVLFDFEKPATRTTLETISTLAHIACFVIADISDAKSILQELQAVVPHNPSVIVQPLLLASQEEPGMFDFFQQYPWVLETYRYSDEKALLAELGERVIAPAELRKLPRQAG